MCIVWFAKVEKIEIMRSNEQLGSFLLGEAYSGSKRGSLIWKMTWLSYSLQRSTFFFFFPYSGHNTERIRQIIFWYDFDESSLSAIYKVDIAHFGEKCSYYSM